MHVLQDERQKHDLAQRDQRAGGKFQLQIFQRTLQMLDKCHLITWGLKENNSLIRFAIHPCYNLPFFGAHPGAWGLLVQLNELQDAIVKVGSWYNQVKINFFPKTCLHNKERDCYVP